jgi:hypothetical protein
MSTGDDGLLRNVTREVLAELLPGLLEEALATPAPNGNGAHHAPPAEAEAGVVPQVPAPPIAKVHRPSTWRPDAGHPSSPNAPAEPPAAAAATGDVERVELRTDADLDRFVRALARRLENPRDRMAIVSGRLRFTLGAGAAAPAAASAAPPMRVEKGAVTERTVREAHAAGARLVLSPRAVLTPMARDRAKSLGVEIQKERPC